MTARKQPEPLDTKLVRMMAGEQEKEAEYGDFDSQDLDMACGDAYRKGHLITRAAHDRAIAEAVANERERCVSAIQVEIETLKVVTESMRSLDGYGYEIRLGEFKITAMQEAITAIRGQS